MDSAKIATPQIIHESETQRQFVRLKMPARIELEGEQYPVRDLSPGGVGVEGIARNHGEGAEIPVKLILPFDGFSLDVDITGRVRHFTHMNKVLGLQFVNLDPDQVSVLTYVVKAYIAGDLLKAGDLLSITARENFVKVRKKKEAGPAQEYSAIFRVRQFAGTGFITLFGILVAIFILSNIYENVFMVKASDGAVTGDTIQIRANQSGLYKNSLPPDTLKVMTGQELGVYADGQKVTSPCDCLVLSQSIAVQDYTQNGAVLVRLAPENTTPYVMVNLPIANAHRLKIEGRATFRVAGTNVEMTGKIKNIETVYPDPAVSGGGGTGAAVGSTGMARVRILPDEKVLLDFIGRPALVKFRL